MMTALENRQANIRSDLELIATTAAVMLELMKVDCYEVAEAMQDGAETIRSLTEKLMENV